MLLFWIYQRKKVRVREWVSVFIHDAIDVHRYKASNEWITMEREKKCPEKTNMIIIMVRLLCALCIVQIFEWFMKFTLFNVHTTLFFFFFVWIQIENLWLKIVSFLFGSINANLYRLNCEKFPKSQIPRCITLSLCRSLCTSTAHYADLIL